MFKPHLALAAMAVAALQTTFGPVHAAPQLNNPMTISATYDAPAGAPSATDVCFSTGIAFDFNAFNTVSLDLAYTGPLGGSPVEISAAVQGAATSSQHPSQICFYFPETPIAPGETLNLVIEVSDNVPADGGFGDSWWTFAETLFQFEYPGLNPPPIPPLHFDNFRVEVRRGPFDPQDLVPFPIGNPDPLQVIFDDGMRITHASESGGAALLGLALLGLTTRRRRAGASLQTSTRRLPPIR